MSLHTHDTTSKARSFKRKNGRAYPPPGEASTVGVYLLAWAIQIDDEIIQMQGKCKRVGKGNAKALGYAQRLEQLKAQQIWILEKLSQGFGSISAKVLPRVISLSAKYSAQ